VVAGDEPYIRELADRRALLPRDEYTARGWPVDCESIRARNHFTSTPASEAERDFPLAFARTVFRVLMLFFKI
jgi:hypothetical protein